MVSSVSNSLISNSSAPSSSRVGASVEEVVSFNTSSDSKSSKEGLSCAGSSLRANEGSGLGSSSAGAVSIDEAAIVEAAAAVVAADAGEVGLASDGTGVFG